MLALHLYSRDTSCRYPRTEFNMNTAVEHYHCSAHDWKCYQELVDACAFTDWQFCSTDGSLCAFSICACFLQQGTLIARHAHHHCRTLGCAGWRRRGTLDPSHRHIRWCKGAPRRSQPALRRFWTTARRPRPSLRCLARLQAASVLQDAIAVLKRCVVISAEVYFRRCDCSIK